MEAFSETCEQLSSMQIIGNSSSASGAQEAVRAVRVDVKRTTVRHGGRQFLVADVRAREVLRVPTLEALNAAMQNFEQQTGALFCIFKSTKHFGELPKRSLLSDHRVRWESRQDTKYSARLDFDGVPYVWLASRLYRCNRFGNPAKLKSAGHRSQSNESSANGRCRPCLCPAAVHVAQLVRFPAYRVQANVERHKERQAERLKRDWSDATTNCVAEQQFVLSLPPASDHNHALAAAQGVSYAYTKTDPRVIACIHTLYRAGVRTLAEMKRRVRETVLSELAAEASDAADPRFFPSDKNICNNMYRAKLLLLAERSQTVNCGPQPSVADAGSSPALSSSYEFADTPLPSINTMYAPDYCLDESAFDDVSCCQLADDCNLVVSQAQSSVAANVARRPEIVTGSSRNEIRFITASPFAANS